MEEFKIFINESVQKFMIGDTDTIDEDMLLAGTIDGHILTIDLFILTLNINLSLLIRNSILNKKFHNIELLLKHNIDIISLEPNIMIMCVETLSKENEINSESDDLEMLINKLIESHAPIDIENFRCVFQLAAIGKLDLLKKIISSYSFENVAVIVGRICAQAIIHGHRNILEYFYPQSEFNGAPDIIFTYFIMGIQYGAHLPIIKFFVEGGMSLRQEDYRAVRVAMQYERIEIIKYFYEIDKSIVDFLQREIVKM